MTTKTHETLIPLAVTCGGVMATHPGTRGLVMMSEHDLERFLDRAADHFVDANKMVQPAGWKLVPVEPTQEMLAAGVPERSAYGLQYAEACYRAMLAAAPQQPAPQPLTDDEKDAARYRWLRDGCNEKGSLASHIAANFYGMEWDAAIDGAIKRAHGIKEQP